MEGLGQNRPKTGQKQCQNRPKTGEKQARDRPETGQKQAQNKPKRKVVGSNLKKT